MIAPPAAASLGLDFGTNSCRALLVSCKDGRELGESVFDYPSGERGVVLDAGDALLARQHPRDYLAGLEAVIAGAIGHARQRDPLFDPGQVVGIGIATTGSTPLPVDRQGTPLALTSAFAGDPGAMAWLWKDHTAHEEAAAITSAARELHPEYLARCGGVYSPEWFWAKIWRCKKAAPKVFAAAASWVELCDYLPALLIGQTAPGQIARSVCAAGHKALYHPSWGGLPGERFLGTLDPALAALRARLYGTAHGAEQKAGGLGEEWARKTGLRPGTTVATGAFDAHMGAVGAGVREGTLVKVMGTSTCDIMVASGAKALGAIPGLCGIVPGSVLPGHHGIEAGQSAVGDIFGWFACNLVSESYGHTTKEKFAGLERAAAGQRPGAHGLLALDWNNGNRAILVDQRLSGLLLGQTLHTTAHEIYRALIEATAFGALRIIERLEEYGVAVREVVNCGGLASKSPLLLQIYADVMGRPMKVARSAQTCALGAAMFGAAAAGKVGGGFASVIEAQSAMCGVAAVAAEPDPVAHAVYQRIYGLYRQLHDAFGTRSWQGNLANVMKDLLAIRADAGDVQTGGN